ncbi:MAG: hypothetical protein RLZZ383_2717 [Pseudomonadota bacterium]
MTPRLSLHPVVALALAASIACGGREATKKSSDAASVRRAPKEATPAATQAPTAAPRTVVLFVLDTVRADHLHLCGYERPTSTFLEKVAARGAALSCRAVAPGTWTLPSHASYFTGSSPTEHHLLNKGLPLDAGFETLAEIYGAAGYATVLVSANPTLSRESGVWQGFRIANVARGVSGEFRGAGLVAEVREALRGLPRDGNLFLVVNLFDAHEPYPEVPKGVGWVPPQPQMRISAKVVDPDHPARAFARGELTPERTETFLQNVRNGYDYGVAQADRTAARVWEALEEDGWLRDGFRLAITSDHGEHLGEHQLVGHDGPPWDAVARVFTLFYDSQLPEQPTFPDPLPNRTIFHLMRDGRLPDPMPAAASASVAFTDFDDRARADGIGLWRSPSDKVLWTDQGAVRFDPVADPLERAPVVVPPDDAIQSELMQQRAALDATKEVLRANGADPAMMQTLQAIGYVQ